MSLAADLMILIGAVLLTFGTDLVIVTAGTGEAAPPAAILGIIISVVGTTFLTSGILISRRRRAPRQTPDAHGR